MIVPEKMKTNHFREVRIPSNKEYFRKFGQYTPGESYYTGEVVDMGNLNKIDQILAGQQEIEAKLAENDEI